jgi:L-threonylcarbamoyladenylate synthase
MMVTKTYKIDKDNIKLPLIKEVAHILCEGGLVAFPTETVYGLGANALDIDAASKIYMAKGRPSDNPLIVHIAHKEDVEKLVTNIPENAKLLMDKFWPGPLTIIFNKSEIVPYGVTGNLETVGIRMPDHSVALAIIDEAGVPIAAPSANTSTRPSPTKASHVLEDLDGRINAIVDGGDVNIGIESTIVDVTSEIPVILRPGYITKAEIEQVIGLVNIDKAILNNKNADSFIAKAPGMKYKHYAPRGEMLIVEGKEENVVCKINELAKEKIKLGKKVGIIATEETKDLYEDGIIISLGRRVDELDISRHLFNTLRELDTLEIEYIFSEGFTNDSVGQAIMNRLLKAAGHNIIKV